MTKKEYDLSHGLIEMEWIDTIGLKNEIIENEMKMYYGLKLRLLKWNEKGVGIGLRMRPWNEMKRDGTRIKNEKGLGLRMKRNKD